MQEEAQQRHEQKLGCLGHGMSRGQTTASLDSLAALVSTQEPGRAPVKVAQRPDTAYEGLNVISDAAPQTAASSSNSYGVSMTGHGSAGPAPPKRAGGKVKPSPRPRQACKNYKIAV